MGLRDLWRNSSLTQQGPYATINHDAGFSMIMNAEPSNLYGMQNMQQVHAVSICTVDMQLYVQGLRGVSATNAGLLSCCDC